MNSQMYFQDIECCSTPIFSFLDLQELSKLKCQLWNKSIYQSIQYVIDQKKTNTILYQTILDPYFDKDELEKTPIVFFSTLQKYMQSHHDTQFDFKNFLFHIFDKMTPNTALSSLPPYPPLQSPKPPQFYLSTRSYRLYMVKYIRPNELILFVQPNDHSVYYTRMVSPSPRQHESDEHHIGYLYQHGAYQKDSTFIQSLLSTQSTISN